MDHITKEYRTIETFGISTGKMEFSSDLLVCRQYGDSYFLCDIDFQNVHKLACRISDNMKSVANSEGLFFRNQNDSKWKIESINPYIKVIEEPMMV